MTHIIISFIHAFINQTCNSKIIESEIREFFQEREHIVLQLGIKNHKFPLFTFQRSIQF